MRERCCRCHITLTSEDKYHYGAKCENCEVDYRYEEHERGQPIKSAYWRWRAICFCMRWLWCSIAGYRSIRLWLVSALLPTFRDEPKPSRQYKKPMWS